MNLKREDFPHIDEHTLELISQGCGGMYKTDTEIIMTVANNYNLRRPCGCPGSSYYIVKRDGLNLLEEISDYTYESKIVKEVIRIDMPIPKNSIKISIF